MPLFFVFLVAAVVRIAALFSAAHSERCRETAANLRSRRMVFSQTNLVVSGATADDFQSIGMATADGLPAFLLCCPRQAARKTAAGHRLRRAFFSPSTFVVRCDSNEQLPYLLPKRLPSGCPLFCSAVHGKQPAKQPPVFNQVGRFSLKLTLLSAGQPLTTSNLSA